MPQALIPERGIQKCFWQRESLKVYYLLVDWEMLWWTQRVCLLKSHWQIKYILHSKEIS